MYRAQNSYNWKSHRALTHSEENMVAEVTLNTKTNNTA